MRHVLRALCLPVLTALLATALLDLWIRGEPLDMPGGLQVALSLVLLVAVAALLLLVLREERQDREA